MCVICCCITFTLILRPDRDRLILYCVLTCKTFELTEDELSFFPMIV